MKNIVSKKVIFNLIGLLSICLSSVAVTMAATAARPARAVQLDPDDRNYVMDTFTMDRESMEVLVTKVESGPYAAFKEYWQTNQNMLGAIAGATGGSSMTLSGVSNFGAAPSGFASSMRMPATVTWGTASAPDGLSWVYNHGDKLICIKFNIAGTPGNYSITSITWYLAAATAPGAGTYVFHDGTRYPLSYSNAPTLPTGFSWYAVTVYPEVSKTLAFGLVDITRNQTARLNVVCPQVADYPPDPCSVLMSFVDANGRTIAQRRSTIAAGKAAFLDAGIIDPNVKNAGVRAVVVIDPNFRTNTPPVVAPSVEVFNTNSGITDLLDPGSIYGFNPQPDPPGFGIFGLAKNQTARINAAYIGFHAPPSDRVSASDLVPAVDVTLRFVDTDGGIVAESRQSIEYGKSVSFDLPAGKMAEGSRQGLRAVVIIDPNVRNITPCIMPSVEIMNDAAERTLVLYPGNLIDASSEIGVY